MSNQRSGQPVVRLRLANLRESLGHRITKPLEPLLTRLRLTPNVITLLGLSLNIFAAISIALGHFVIGGVIVLLAGLSDLLDGALARATKQASTFGALLDSAADRLSEAAIFFGILISYAPWEGSTLEVWLIYLSLVGSLMVSYIRARSEGLGLQCKVGILTRAERILILALGLMLNQITIALSLIVILTFTTMLQRLLFVRRQLREQRMK